MAVADARTGVLKREIGMRKGTRGKVAPTPMIVFVGFGYNDRDHWIELQVFPILVCMGFTVVSGKGLHGQVISPEVQTRIEQADAVLGFLTLREGQGDAEFNSHIWVRDELVYAAAKGKPLIPVKEATARVPDGLLGNRQYIALHQDDRLACVAELVSALGRRNIRRLKIEPESDELRRNLKRWRRDPGFTLQYRTQDENGIESAFRTGRLELVDQAFYLNVSDVSRRSYVEVEGSINGSREFSSGWSSADAVQVDVS